MLEWTGERFLPNIDPLLTEPEIHFEHLHRYAFAMEFVKGKDVLDLASGEGYGSYFLSKTANRVIGIDVDGDAVTHAAQTYVRSNLKFLQGDIRNIPIEGQKLFDVVVCFEVLEHIVEQEQLLSEIKRLLKDNGSLIISTPNKIFYSDERNYTNPFHKRELDSSEFQELLRKYFTNIYLLGQKISNGSYIYEYNKTNSPPGADYYLKRENESYSFTNKNAPPMYFLAVASEKELEHAFSTKSFCIDTSDSILEQRENKVYNTNTFCYIDSGDGFSEEKIISKIVTAKPGETPFCIHFDLGDYAEIKSVRWDPIKGHVQRIIIDTIQLEMKNGELRTIDSRLLETNGNRISSNEFLFPAADPWIILPVEGSINGVTISGRWSFKGFKEIIAEQDAQILKYHEYVRSFQRHIKHVESEKEYFAHKLREREQHPVWKIYSQFAKFATHGNATSNEIKNKITGFLRKNRKNSINKQELYAAYQPIGLNDEYEVEKQFVFSDFATKLIAFYLPQFHPFPENDRFWGKGFTEWTNTSKALPLFFGHYQPRLPGELGFYDTRLKEVMKRQIELAKSHGIYGFCLYHYWFQGKPIMRVPYEQILTNEDFDVPFCLCWANEPWTARFDGLSTLGDVLIPQVHTPEDDVAFFMDIKKALIDKRYIRIEGKPLLIIYRPGLFPDIKKTVALWRDLAKKEGISELFLVMVQNTFDGIIDPRTLGFDASIEFPPQNIPLRDIKSQIGLFDPDFQGYVYEYPELVKKSLERKKPEYILFRGICPGWDCTPRRKNPVIFIGSNPDEYQKWLEGILKYSNDSLDIHHRLVFINAWNEWTEGAYLEPDRKYGYAYLNSTCRALISTNLKLAVILHLFYPDLAEEIISFLKNIPYQFDLFISTPREFKSQIESIFHILLPDFTIVVKGVENRGYDIAPFIIEFKDTFRRYDLVLKIHGKKSVHWKNKDVWRRYLMSNLLGSELVVRSIVNRFTEMPALGMLFPENFPRLGDWLRWGENFSGASQLLGKMDIHITENSAMEFPAGSMYWFRPAAIEPIFQLDQKYSDFNNSSTLDGTLAHAIERSVLFILNKTGYTWQKVCYYDKNLIFSSNWVHLKNKKFGKIAVIIHLFYIELLDEFIIHLKNIPYAFDIYISTQPHYRKTVEEQLRRHFPDVIIDVRGVENYGYDIYPFILVFKDIIKKYEYICKIHGKKSDHHPEFSGWRKYLLDNLLGSQFIVEKILSNFKENPNLGLMFPEIYPPTKDFIEWGSNFEIAKDLMKMNGIELEQESQLVFPAGSMFWFRPNALEPLFNLPITIQMFQEGGNKNIDGTLSHAIERIILKIVEQQNFSWEVITPIS